MVAVLKKIEHTRYTSDFYYHIYTAADSLNATFCLFLELSTPTGTNNNFINR